MEVANSREAAKQELLSTNLKELRSSNSILEAENVCIKSRSIDLDGFNQMVQRVQLKVSQEESGDSAQVQNTKEGLEHPLEEQITQLIRRVRQAEQAAEQAALELHEGDGANKELTSRIAQMSEEVAGLRARSGYAY